MGGFVLQTPKHGKLMSPQDNAERHERAVRTVQVQRRILERALWESQLLGRLRAAAGNHKFCTLAEMTGVHAETVRRYMTYGRPSLFFVVAMSQALNVPLEWLIHGTLEEDVDPAPARSARNGTASSERPSLRITTPSSSGSRVAATVRTRKMLGSR